MELAVRAAIVALLQAADSSLAPGLQPRVWDHPRFVQSEQEWLKVAAIQNPQNNQTGQLETRVVFIELQRVAETDEGACFHTQIDLRYAVDVMFGLVDDQQRKDSSNSHDDFVAYVMRARAAFADQANRSFGYPRNQIEHKLLQTVRDARVEKIDFATVHRWEGSVDVIVG